jgi:HAD superfamily hydrolase (TIGR01490 family)
MPQSQPRPFAVFDIDGTLIRWQLFHAIVHRLGKYGHIPADSHQRVRRARAAWKVRTTNEGFTAYEKVLVQEYLAAIRGVRPAEYATIMQDVFDEYKDQTFTFTRDLIQRLKDDGYILAAISGSQHEIIKKLAAHHGFDVAVGAIFEQINGQFSGRVDTPVFDKAKVLRRLVKEHNLSLEDSYGVGDSMSDASMLELVKRPIAFNPDKKFFAVARERGWKVVVERKNMIYELEYKDAGYTLRD